ncbi:alpha/beta-hydrolase [Dacryopinax primogenitus]|uniref:Alpha/beta-hydrolase n=1 Tax=Dacryopinax primogenitus (strain DJM 731) TaxID=1858805 RepID=M5GBP0_DACPD|nr:alpha/beta-hydrolase [Dacryopinax primogenitus]EJU01428.1 alpha/beta-hydrolase [Dacryopinax primogenitus]
MERNAYPPPPGPMEDYVPYAVRSLPPIVPVSLPQHLRLPNLPSPQRESPFPEFVLTTHLTPCARMRAHPTATKPSIRPAYPGEESTGQGKRGRAREVSDLTHKLWQQWEEVHHTPSWVGEEGPQLWAVVNRFVRRGAEGGAGGLTLFFVHSNGYPKETWEPLIGMILCRSVKVDEILVWESFNHGNAALINAPHLGDTYDWADNARDIMTFLTHYRPLTHQPAPVHLPSHAKEPTAKRVIGIGHSHGGEILCRTAVHCPESFTSVMLVEPIIIPEFRYDRRLKLASLKAWDMLRKSTLIRRSVWPSMEEARLFFLRSPFFQHWHPDVLEAYMTHAFFPLPDSQGVKLKQSPFDESICYFDPRGPSESWYLLPQLDERVELRFVLGEAGHFTGGEEVRRHTVWRRRGNCSNVRIGAGHFIPQEAPELLAEEVLKMIGRHHPRVELVQARL